MVTDGVQEWQPPSLGAPGCRGGRPGPGCRRLQGGPGAPCHLLLPQVLFQGSDLLNSGVGAFLVVVFVSCICCPFYTATLARSWREVRSDEASPYLTHLLLLFLLCLVLGVGGLGVVQVTTSPDSLTAGGCPGEPAELVRDRDGAAGHRVLHAGRAGALLLRPRHLPHVLQPQGRQATAGPTGRHEGQGGPRNLAKLAL